jgi:hypothetical protein
MKEFAKQVEIAMGKKYDWRKRKTKYVNPKA